MTKVLGYPKYFAQGGDWGSHILRATAEHHSNTAPCVHLNMFYCPEPLLAQYASYVTNLPLPTSITSWVAEKARFWGLNEPEIRALRRSDEFTGTGRGYSSIQSTKPSTIGYSIGVSPLSLLAYIGEKMQAWSDPSAWDVNDLLETVAIYYFTESFHTSVIIYLQSKDERVAFESTVSWGKLKSKLGLSAFPYEVRMYPRSWIEKCGPVVQYNTHSKGGHFPALDNPEALIADVRMMASKHWWTNSK